MNSTSLPMEWIQPVADAYQKLKEACDEVERTHAAYVENITSGFQKKLEAEMDKEPTIALASSEWNSKWWKEYQPAQSDVLPALLRIGNQKIDLGKQVVGMPALLPLMGYGHALVSGGNSDEARQFTQTLALRLALSAPPGSVEFNLSDPDGGGAHVAYLMSLPAQICAQHAASSTQEIEELLDDTMAHIKTIVRERLASEYKTLGDYNDAQPEQAVPHRALVMMDFPANMSAKAWEALLFTLRNGLRAGVCVIACAAPDIRLPREMKFEDIAQHFQQLRVDGPRVSGKDVTGAEISAELDPAPPAEAIQQATRAVGEALRARTTHVPFGRVAVPEREWWLASSAEGINVPVGTDSRGGAMRFELKHNGATHALVGGTTGSGKSKFLDIVITQLACRYSPDELLFYLVDLSQGVMFNKYADLPHARALSLENDREFALAILRAAVDEMAARGEAFKQAGGAVENIADYRRAGKSMPRVLFIIDEYHVLFASGDRLSGEANDLLIEIAKQGRKFGIHLLLSSQTSSPANMRSKEVMEQLGLRIAFRCSAEVSQSILGERNAAAAELNEPGEAVFNASLGQPQFNTRMRVAYQSPEDYAAQIAQIGALSHQKYHGNPPRPKTYSASAVGNLLSYPPFAARLKAPPHMPLKTADLWLGHPLALDDSVLRIRRDTGGNLAIVGDDTPNAYGLLTSVALSLMAQTAPDGLRLALVDLSQLDTEFETYWRKFQKAAGGRIEIASRKAGVDLIAQFCQQMEARENGEASRSQSWVLMVCGIHRWRELDKPDGYDKNKAAARLMAVLDRGPEYGVHTVMWGETLAGFERRLERNWLSFVDARLALKVSETDSSALIGSPAAAKMQSGRVWLRNQAARADDEMVEGQLRPFSYLNDEELASITAQSLFAGR